MYDIVTQQHSGSFIVDSKVGEYSESAMRLRRKPAGLATTDSLRRRQHPLRGDSEPTSLGKFLASMRLSSRSWRRHPLGITHLGRAQLQRPYLFLYRRPFDPTSLRELSALAEGAGVQCIRLQDEAERFGLGSFKAFGGAYAGAEGLSAELVRRGAAPEMVDYPATRQGRWS